MAASSTLLCGARRNMYVYHHGQDLTSPYAWIGAGKYAACCAAGVLLAAGTRGAAALVLLPDHTSYLHLAGPPQPGPSPLLCMSVARPPVPSHP